MEAAIFLEIIVSVVILKIIKDYFESGRKDCEVLYSQYSRTSGHYADHHVVFNMIYPIF